MPKKKKIPPKICARERERERERDREREPFCFEGKL